MMIEYSRENPDVYPPTRANPSDAGLDVFAYLPENPAVIEAGQNSLISTGLRFGVPHGYMLQVCNRSSMGAKRSLVVGAHIIDSGYDGEVFIDLHNIGSLKQVIYSGDKIAQLVMVPVVPFRALEKTNGDLYDWYPIAMSARDDGSLGSTDKSKPEHPLNGQVSGF